MSISDSLAEAMHLPSEGDTVRRIHESGLAIANVDTMSQAIHDVYCGIMADHHEPSEKDRAQAAELIERLRKYVGEPAQA